MNSGGYKLSELTKARMKANHKGMLGMHHSEESKAKIRTYRHTDETRRKMSQALQGRTFTEEHKTNLSSSLLGHPVTLEVRQKLSEVSKQNIGEKNPNWKGGASFEPYSPDFTWELKEAIKQRDSYLCRLCSIPEMECLQPHCVHHIDYDKENDNPSNLITLCRICHGYTNGNRQYWQTYLSNYLEENFIKEVKNETK